MSRTEETPRVVRGVMRLLIDLGYAPLAEVTLRTGRRVDVMGLGAKGELCAVEVKSSREDFLVDRKWPEYLEFVDLFYFAVGPAFPLEILPDGEGLIIADAYHGEIIRPAVPRQVAAARRKTVLLRYARTAALRLDRLLDPGLPDLAP